MCAIYGIVGKYIKEEAISSFLKLSHRGIDDSNFIADENTFFGIHRLAIETFESELNQPFIENEYISVFNGEIYNYKELLKELNINEQSSEIEAILECYKKFGDDFVNRLEGMFAIAIYDGKALKLFRDRVGKKPLYYKYENGTFSFASEIKALLNSSHKKQNMLPTYLSYQTAISPDTFFDGIYSLDAGSYLVFDGNIIIKKYFYTLDHPTLCKDEKSAIEVIKKSLYESFEKRLPNENIDFCSLLSGGIDSSLVSAMASKYHKIDTFCIGYEERFSSYDERRYAKVVAEHIGSNHHEIVLTKDKFFDTLDKLVQLFDEPIGDPATVPLYVMLGEIKKSGKRVVFSGDGSDELFFGYTRYREFYDLENISKLKNKNWLKNYFRSNYSLNKEWEWYKRALEGSIVFRSSSELFTDLQQNRLLKQNIKDDSSLETIAPFWDEYIKSGRQNILDWYSFCDMKIRLGELYLKKLDMVSMACGIEVRSPFLDSRVIENAFAIDAEIRLGETNKNIIKSIAKDYLPQSIINRKKRGFSYPFMEWLIEENGLEIINRVHSKRKIFNDDYLKFILDKVHTKGFKNQVFALYMYCRWLERN